MMPTTCPFRGRNTPSASSRRHKHEVISRCWRTGIGGPCGFTSALTSKLAWPNSVLRSEGRSHSLRYTIEEKGGLMQLGMIGLGRMGANMVRRLTRGGHQCVVYDRSPEAVQALVKEHAVGTSSLDEFVSKLTPPRAAWLMVPAAFVDNTLADLTPRLSANDIVIDGGNSYYIDDLRRFQKLAPKGIHYVDVGTSGGVWGLERGYCLMIGGPKSA